MSTIIKTYSELITFPTIEARFDYLKLFGEVGVQTFGFERSFNQLFYRSSEWKHARQQAILRDCGHELAMPDDEWEIVGNVYVHHINPIDPRDLDNGNDALFDPENLVCCSFDVHNAIHFCSALPVRPTLVVRAPNDQCPWRH